MGTIGFVFYILVYTIGILNIAIVGALYNRDREPTYRREFFLMLAFALNLLCRIVSSSQGPQAYTPLLSALVQSGLYTATGLMIWAIPTYVIGFMKGRLPPRFSGTLATVGMGFAALTIASGIIFQSTLMGYVTFFTMVGVVLWTIIRGIASSIGKPSPVKRDSTSKIAMKAGICTLITMPLIIACDFFNLRIPVLSELFPNGFYAVSIIFLFWSSLMIAERAPTLLAGPSRLPVVAPSLTPDPVTLDQLGISDREREVLALLLQGKSYAEISMALFISLATVKTHVSHIYKKVGVGSKMELAHALLSA